MELKQKYNIEKYVTAILFLLYCSLIFYNTDIVQLLIIGWWFVSNGKDEGWAPCSYLEGEKDEGKQVRSPVINMYC